MTSPTDPEVMNRVAQWRQMEALGTMTDEERIKAVIYLREVRRSAETSSKASSGSSKAKKPSKSADDLLSELGL